MKSDLTLAVRHLLKNPAFATVAILILALGIGVNTAMFSGLQALLMPDLPFPNPDQLVRVFRTSPHSQRWPHSPANFLDQQRETSVFSHVAATTSRPANLAEPGQPAERLRALLASADLIPMLGIPPAIGRPFQPEEDQPGHNKVVLLNHPFWVRRFNADPNILGRALRLDGESVTVIGVMPKEFAEDRSLGRFDLIRPIAFPESERNTRGNHYLDVFARLKPGVTVPQANAALATLAAHLREQHPDSNADTGLRAANLGGASMDPRGRTMVWLILGLAGLVLLIACANLANLQFARTTLRARELAIRSALGAPNRRLIRQLLTENLVLAACGGLLGLLLAQWTNHWLVVRLSEDGRPPFQPELNLAVLAFAFLATTLSALAFGLIPAWLGCRLDLNVALRQGTRAGDASRTQHRLRNSLIVAQAAMALMLLAGAGLVVNGLTRFSTVNPGWRIDGLHSGHLNLPASTYPDADSRHRFALRLQASLSSLAGVQAAALASALPISGARSHVGLSVEAPTTPVSNPLSSLWFVSPGFFSTLGIRLVEGRDFTPADSIDHPSVAIINESFARACWPDASALGRRIGSPGAWQEIIGVVADTRAATDPSEPTSRFQYYRPLAQEPRSDLAIAVRGTVTPETLRRTVEQLDADLPLSEAGAVRSRVERFLGLASVAGWLLAAFAGLGLVLASLGTYGVLAAFVGQRTREIGVRMALGATIRDVLWLVARQGLLLTSLGIGIGLLGSMGLARSLHALTPGLDPNQPVVLALVCFLLILAAALACWIPARRAAAVHPMVALRNE